MRITAWRLSADGLTPVPENELSSDWNELSRDWEADDHPYWVDAVGASPERV